MPAMAEGPGPFISFLSDFGTDGAAAICRGVILSACPDARIVDVAHSISKFAIAEGAFVLAASLPYMPVGVHLAVVDPGVGTQRRPVALRVERGDRLVGPDNGLLIDAAEALGGIVEARALANPDLWRPDRSSTFHGRDLFAPTAARLAAGSVAFDQLGPAIPADDLERLPEPVVAVADGRLETQVIYVDSFGNVRLAGSARELDSAFRAGEEVRVEWPDAASAPELDARRVGTFGEVGRGELLLYLDSSGHPALAIREGSLAGRVGEVKIGQRVRIGRAT